MALKVQKEIFIPTWQKIGLTLLTSVLTLLTSLTLGFIELQLKGGLAWKSFSEIILIFINFGGGIGDKLFYMLKGLGVVDSGPFWFYVLPLVFQLSYLYVIVSLVLNQIKHRTK